ncbi:MAG: GNAT family N-acetyltransferase [Sphingobium sp.]
MSAGPAIVILEADPAGTPARACLDAYYAELRRRSPADFQPAFDPDPDPGTLARPHGLFLLALSAGEPLGCIALKPLGPALAEVKRLWIDPAARGLGLSRRLMQAVEDGARSLGYTTLRLDTNSALAEALALYRSSGWTQIDRYNDDPYPDHFFEKVL